jgi:hypothetical protein
VDAPVFLLLEFSEHIAESLEGIKAGGGAHIGDPASLFLEQDMPALRSGAQVETELNHKVLISDRHIALEAMNIHSLNFLRRTTGASEIVGN